MMRTKPRLSRCTNMAAGERSSIALAVCVLCLLLSQAAAVDGKGFPDSAMVGQWAGNLGRKLVNLLNTLTGYHPITRSFQDAIEKCEFKKVEPETLVKNMAGNLSKILSKKMDSLWNLVEAAEKAAKNYTYNPNLKKGDVNYCNAKDMLYSNITLEYNAHFKQEVNLNLSCVHIPVEIYDGDIDILNGLQWTEALDEQFKRNFAKDPDMLWQFFGSQTGFMRTYPASKWNTHGDVDLFDVRRQSWYTQGSSSPKDMMILIDTSGSTHGQALQLMKNAVKSILDTLGENDFVNIVEFSQEAKFVSQCFNHTAFVQANYRNKKQLEKDVDNLKAMGQADYEKGLRFAFEKFKEFSENETNEENNVGANCNKVIILLTDGGTDNAEEVFKEYNWPNKSVRVFTYAVGPTATPVAAIRWMACANRGYFSQIPAMGAIRARVQDYLEVMGRPLALKYVEHTQWTSSHKSPLNKENSGLGMMTTVTLPVYNRTLGSSNQTILGVMGIDVPTAELSKRTPYLEIGPVGYSFAINPNGYAVFHPNLKNTGRYMKDPPNIDLMELELQHEGKESEQLLKFCTQGQQDGNATQICKLRNEMIEGITGQMDLENILFLSPDKKYVSMGNARYAFTNITNTTFRLGLAVPTFRMLFCFFENANNIPDIQLPNNGEAFLIAPWDYLGTLLEDNNKTYPLNGTLASLVAALTELKKDPSTKNNLTDRQLQLLHHLKMDLHTADEAFRYFSAVKRTPNETDTSNSTYDDSATNTTTNFTIDWESLHGFKISNALVHFLGTEGGLTVVNPASEANQFDNDLDLSNSTYYKRSMLSNGYILSADPAGQNLSRPTVTASRALYVLRTNTHKIAVTGVKLDEEGLREYVMSSFKDNTSQARYLTCDDEDSVVCYLVDDGGFLVTSNQDNQTYMPGKFLGEVDPEMWQFLVSKEIYGRAVEYDFQATCKVPKDTPSAGHRTSLVPRLDVLFEALTTSWWTGKIAWAYTSFNIYNWLFGSADMYAEAADCCPSPAYEDDTVTSDAEDDSQKEEEDCVKAVQQFYLLPDLQPLDGDFNTSSCGEIRNIRIHAVDQTNLVFIVADLPCDTSSNRVQHGPYKISEEEEKEQICKLSEHPRKRKLSYGCYDYDEQEDDSKCDATSLATGRLLSLATTCVSLISVWLLTSENR